MNRYKAKEAFVIFKKNKNKLKYIAVVIFCSILDMILHVMTSKISSISQLGNFSIFVKTLGMPVVAVLWMFIAFGSVAYVFFRYGDKFSGSKNERGLRFGCAVGLLWFWGVVEGIAISGNTFGHESVMALCDAIPIILLGVLLGKFTTGRNCPEEKRESLNLNSIMPTVFIFSIVFLVGRYLFYITKIIKSGYAEWPMATFIWTLFMGAFVGISYILLGQATKSSKVFSSAVKFGVLIFGVCWASFQLFIPLIYAGTLADIILRCIIDIALAIIGYYLSESLAKKQPMRKSEMCK